jgi:hypothetical protein
VYPKGLLSDHIKVRQWVGNGGELHHFPILLELEKVRNKPLSPFKFNPSWLEYDEFIKLVKDKLSPFDSSKGESTPIQFVQNLNKIKYTTIIRNKGKRENQPLSEVETRLESLYN